MLDHQKVVAQLDKVSKDLYVQFAKEHDLARQTFDLIAQDLELAAKIQAKKYSVLVPWWTAELGFSKKIENVPFEYSVLAVDGSQIFYDKHQGPACYLINVGSVLLEYGAVKSSVTFTSDPQVIVGAQQADAVSEKREDFELQAAAEQSIAYQKKHPEKVFTCLLDGPLIFSNVQLATVASEQSYALSSYLNSLAQLQEHQVLHTGYLSFPRSKELVSVLKLVMVQFDDRKLQELDLFARLSDADVAAFFLKPGFRSTIFASKAPVTYVYPKDLKPHFCFVHVGQEIVRLEFPAWIVRDEKLVDLLCQIALDQARKGGGYPVSLFEAHEQAVVKAVDRQFFYSMIQKMSQKYQGRYDFSYKSMKKTQPPV